MTFEPTLQKIVDECGGAVAAALMSSDGIPIAQVLADARPPDLELEDISVVGAEFGRALEELRKASATLGGGALEETQMSFARFCLVFRIVDPETFLVVALAPDANLGKARYLLRRHLADIREDL